MRAMGLPSLKDAESQNSSESPFGKKYMFSWIAGLGETTTEHSLEQTFSESRALQNVHGDWMPRKDHNKQ